MGDAEPVGVIEGPGAFEDDLDDPFDGQQMVALGVGFEGAPRDVLHDDRRAFLATTAS